MDRGNTATSSQRHMYHWGDAYEIMCHNDNDWGLQLRVRTKKRCGKLEYT